MHTGACQAFLASALSQIGDSKVRTLIDRFWPEADVRLLAQSEALC